MITIGIRTKRKAEIICFICKDKVGGKYYYLKPGDCHSYSSVLRYCLKCGELKLMSKSLYDKKKGKKYGIERRV